MIVKSCTDQSPCSCDDCDWKGPRKDLKAISNLEERLDVGIILMPEGECPACGTLAYLDTAHDKWKIQKDRLKMFPDLAEMLDNTSASLETCLVYCDTLVRRARALVVEIMEPLEQVSKAVSREMVATGSGKLIAALRECITSQAAHSMIFHEHDSSAALRRRLDYITDVAEKAINEAINENGG